MFWPLSHRDLWPEHRFPRTLWLEFGKSFVAIGAKRYVTFCEMHVPFGPNNIFLVPFGLNLANVHCGSWGQRVRDFLQNARNLCPELNFPRTLWLEFDKGPLWQLGPKGA